METYRQYNDELTEEERTLGFIRALVNNPDFEFYGHGSIVPAVIFRLGNGDRIIKLSNPGGGVEYSHQVYGTYGTGGRADWMPVLVPFPNATIAIRAAQSGRDAASPGGQTVHPATPSIPLRCPKCAHEFDAQVDHLPIGSTQTCPACNCQEPIEEFSRTNL